LGEDQVGELGVAGGKFVEVMVAAVLEPSDTATTS